MKTTKKILAILLAMMMALSVGVTAAAANVTDADGWTYLPTSPDGLSDGDMWFDCTYLVGSDATEEEIAALKALFSAGSWYVKMDEHLVKCVSDNELNGTYTRSQEPYILCIREVGVSWVDVHKDLAGIQVGDYYLDEAVFRSVCAEKFTDYFMPQAIESYTQQYGAAPTEEQTAQIRANLKAQLESNIVETYWSGNTYSYNPHGTFYRYKINTLPVPWGYYIVDGGIARQMMLVVDALNASIRQADAATVASSPWKRVASSIEDTEEGGYYIDFTDTAAVMAAFGMTQTPTAEEMAIVTGGEWYADFSRGVVTGKISLDAGNGEEYSYWMPESETLFGLLKVKPVCNHINTVTIEEIEATRNAHGYTEGVFCQDCQRWISGHEVIHNTYGKKTILREPTYEEEGLAEIYCTVCGEKGLYAIELKTPGEENDDNDFISTIRKAVSGIINWFLRLIKWLGGK